MIFMKLKYKTYFIHHLTILFRPLFFFSRSFSLWMIFIVLLGHVSIGHNITQTWICNSCDEIKYIWDLVGYFKSMKHLMYHFHENLKELMSHKKLLKKRNNMKKYMTTKRLWSFENGDVSKNNELLIKKKSLVLFTFHVCPFILT